MSLLKLFRFFRPISENLDPLSRLAQSPAEPAPSAHTKPEPMAPVSGTRNVQAWLCEGDGSFPTQVHGESFYPREIALAIAERKPWKEECDFQVVLLPEKNIHDKNAVAVYRSGGGQVGHLTRDCAGRWRPVIDELLSLGGVVPACRATAGCAYEGGPIGIMLDITLSAIRAELDRRKSER